MGHVDTWRAMDVGLRDRFEKDGVLYEVVAIAYDPVVTIRPVDDDECEECERHHDQHHVIISRNFAEFTKLVPTRPDGSVVDTS